MMQLEPGPDTMKDAEDSFSNRKRIGELLDEEDSKKSKADTGCDATLATDTSTSPKNLVSDETKSPLDNFNHSVAVLTFLTRIDS